MKTCLVVTNSHGLQRGMSKRLLAEGLNPSGEVTFATALKACRRSMPSVIFVDFHMGSTLEAPLGFVASVRALPGGDKPKIIACFFLFVDAIEKTMTMEAGVNASLVLTADTTSLAADIHMSLESADRIN
jgi:hypothetical protein